MKSSASTTGAFVADANSVYPPREDTFLLLPFTRLAPGRRLLEVGAGNGTAALAAARRGTRVVATDLNPFALRRLRARARAERLPLDAVRTDLARGLGRFDRVLANPPYLPTRPDERDPDRWQNLALDGGTDGCRVLARLVLALPDHLAPGADAYVVVSSRQDARRRDAIRRGWLARGGRWSVVAERRFEGERLHVWRLSLDEGGNRARNVRRARARRPGTGARRRTPPARRSASSRAPGPGSTSARGAASIRRRSPRGW